MTIPPEKWFLGVSFKQDLFSEYIIEDGYKYTGNFGLPVSLRFRKYVDNDICGIKEEYDEYADEIRKDYQKFLPHIFECVQNAAEKFISFSKRLSEDELKRDSNNELKEKFKRYCELYERAAGPALPMGFLGEMVMVPVLKERVWPLLAGEMSYPEFTKIISLPSKITIVAQERIDLLKIAKKIYDNKLCKEFFEQNSSLRCISFLEGEYTFLLEDIEKHSTQYIWLLKTLLSGEDYTILRIIGRLQELIKNNPQEELERITQETQKRKEELNQLCEKLPLKFKQDIILFQEVFYFRDVRLMWLNEGCHYSMHFLQEIAKRLGITYEEIIYLLPQEIEKGLIEGLTVPKPEIQKRIEKYAMVMENHKIMLYAGEEVEQHRVKKNGKEGIIEVKGHSASQGKARGRVIIVKDWSELHKVKKGHILITKLTTPDFVVAMEKAAAIVTDLGGITSHAAIVSRELGVPCIIGTEIATQVFKDGDLVDVDATEGIIRKIDRED